MFPEKSTFNNVVSLYRATTIADSYAFDVNFYEDDNVNFYVTFEKKVIDV